MPRADRIPTSYTIYEDNGTYHADCNTCGGTNYDGTNAATVINLALLSGCTAGRDWYEKVVLKGDFTIDAPLLVDDWTDFELIGRITRANLQNDYMIRNVDFTNGNNYIEIHGGYWDGNSANQTGSGVTNRDERCVVHIEAGGGNECERIRLYDMKIDNTKGHGVFLFRVGNSHVHDMDIGIGVNPFATIAGLYARAFSDGLIWDITVRGYRAAVWLYSPASSSFSDFHIGGATGGNGIYIEQGGFNCRFNVISMDQIKEHGILIEGTNHHDNVWSHLSFSDIGISADNTYDCVHFDQSSGGTHNVFSIGNYYQTSESEFARHGVYEVGAGVDYNTYIGFDFSIVAGGAFRELGSNSEVYSVQGFVTENWGITEASDGDWVNHGLVWTPNNIQLTVEEVDSQYFAQIRDKNSTQFQLYLYDQGAGTLEATDKTIHWHAWASILSAT